MTTQRFLQDNVVKTKRVDVSLANVPANTTVVLTMPSHDITLNAAEDTYFPENAALPSKNVFDAIVDLYSMAESALARPTVEEFIYSASGQLTQLNYADGSTSQLTYDANKRVSQLVTKTKDNARIITKTFVYDGNRISKIITS